MTRAIRKKNLMWSTAALVLVLLLVPAVLGTVEAINNSIADEYRVTYDADSFYVSNHTVWGYRIAPIVFKSENATGVVGYLDGSGSYFQDVNGTEDTLFVNFGADSVSVTLIAMNCNYTIASLEANDASRLYVRYFTSSLVSKNITIVLQDMAWDEGNSDTAFYNVHIWTVPLTNGTYEGYLSLSRAEMLQSIAALSSYQYHDFALWVRYEDESSFVDGEEIDFSFQFEGQKGVSESALTPFLVGGLGVFLMVAAVASTDVFDPTSKYEVINVFGKKYYRKKRWVK